MFGLHPDDAVNQPKPPSPPLPNYASPGQRLFEAAVAEGIPMHPTEWAELHPDWQAAWGRIATRTGVATENPIGTGGTSDGRRY